MISLELLSQTHVLVACCSCFISNVDAVGHQQCYWSGGSLEVLCVLRVILLLRMILFEIESFLRFMRVVTSSRNLAFCGSSYRCP